MRQLNSEGHPLISYPEHFPSPQMLESSDYCQLSRPVAVSGGLLGLLWPSTVVRRPEYSRLAGLRPPSPTTKAAMPRITQSTDWAVRGKQACSGIDNDILMSSPLCLRWSGSLARYQNALYTKNHISWPTIQHDPQPPPQTPSLKLSDRTPIAPLRIPF